MLENAKELPEKTKPFIRGVIRAFKRNQLPVFRSHTTNIKRLKWILFARPI